MWIVEPRQSRFLSLERPGGGVGGSTSSSSPRQKQLCIPFFLSNWAQGVEQRKSNSQYQIWTCLIQTALAWNGTKKEALAPQRLCTPPVVARSTVRTSAQKTPHPSFLHDAFRPRPSSSDDLRRADGGRRVPSGPPLPPLRPPKSPSRLKRVGGLPLMCQPTSLRGPRE